MVIVAGSPAVLTALTVAGAGHMTACALVYLAVGLPARTVLKARPSAARVVTRISGAAMIVIGTLLLVERLAA